MVQLTVLQYLTLRWKKRRKKCLLDYNLTLDRYFTLRNNFPLNRFAPEVMLMEAFMVEKG